MRKQHLRIVYIQPSTYDDEGYILRFWRGILPSNSLCCLKSLTEATIASGELGPEIEATVEIYDETVQNVPISRIARANGRPDRTVLVGLVGVQSNQFARATDLALAFRERGVPVMVGGFHVSGVLATQGEPSPELRRLLDAGATLVQGEVETPGALARMFRDAAAGKPRPIYEMPKFPEITEAAVPQPDAQYLKHYVSRRMATVDTSRGCPFNCSFCTVINVQGRRMRSRSAAGIIESIERNYYKGVSVYFFTDDNLARSPVWEDIFDGLIEMRQRGLDIQFMMQIDTRAYRIRNFADKARRAGCFMVFIGMETVNPKNIEAMAKGHNHVDDYANMSRVWHEAGVIVHVGYIIGLPHDTRASVASDIETLKDHVKVDQATFFMLTPLPGSRDYLEMLERGQPADADLNNYDTLHETFRHDRMAPGEWLAAYREAWGSFYSPENIVDILLRVPRKEYWFFLWVMVWHRYAALTGEHPMFTGVWRRKRRRERRATYPRENPLAFAWRRIRDLYGTARVYARVFCEFQEIWMLTRKPDDPRFAVLSDLRARWADTRCSLRESAMAERWDLAAQSVRATIDGAAARLREVAENSQTYGRRFRRKMRRKASEAEAFLRSFETGNASWLNIVQAEKFLADNLVGGYEELAIRYVARRRKFSAYRRDLLARLRSGRLAVWDFCVMPRALAAEVFFGLLFAYRFYRKT